MTPTGHLTQWLDAYHDGELKGPRLRQVEAHLADCEICRAALEQIQALSDLLHLAPPAENLTAPEIFTAQVRLRLPREARQSGWQRALRLGWQAAPLGILAAWAFLHAALFVSGVVSLGLEIIPGGEQIISLMPLQSDPAAIITGTSFFDLGRVGLDFLVSGSPILGWGSILDLSLTTLVGLLYLSWLASWWVQQSNGNELRSMDSMERNQP